MNGTVDLQAGEAAINPRNVWHTSDIDERCRTLFVTPVEAPNTEHADIRSPSWPPACSNTRVAEIRVKNLDRPGRDAGVPRLTVKQVDLGDITVGMTHLEPGWRWSNDVRPEVGGDWCEARHVGVVLSGRFGVTMRDGTTVEFGPNDVFEIPPGHDGFVVGDEPCVADRVGRPASLRRVSTTRRAAAGVGHAPVHRHR